MTTTSPFLIFLSPSFEENEEERQTLSELKNIFFKRSIPFCEIRLSTGKYPVAFKLFQIFSSNSWPLLSYKSHILSEEIISNFEEKLDSILSESYNPLTTLFPENVLDGLLQIKTTNDNNYENDDKNSNSVDSNNLETSTPTSAKKTIYNLDCNPLVVLNLQVKNDSELEKREQINTNKQAENNTFLSSWILGQVSRFTSPLIYEIKEGEYQWNTLIKRTWYLDRQCAVRLTSTKYILLDPVQNTILQEFSYNTLKNIVVHEDYCILGFEESQEQLMWETEWHQADEVDETPLNFALYVLYLSKRKLPVLLNWQGTIGYETRLFGSTLEELATNSHHFHSSSIPRFIYYLLEGIKDKGLIQEGMFRQSGSKNIIDAAMAAANRGEEINMELLDVNDMSSILKYFLRDLRQPIFPMSIYDDLININQSGLKGEEAAKEVRKLLISNNVPTSHFEILKKLTELLCESLKYESQNRMTIQNLATVFAPNLFSQEINAAQCLKDLQHQSAVVSVMISNFSIIFDRNGNNNEGFPH